MAKKSTVVVRSLPNLFDNCQNIRTFNLNPNTSVFIPNKFTLSDINPCIFTHSCNLNPHAQSFNFNLGVNVELQSTQNTTSDFFCSYSVKHDEHDFLNNFNENLIYSASPPVVHGKFIEEGIFTLNLNAPPLYPGHYVYEHSHTCHYNINLNSHAKPFIPSNHCSEVLINNGNISGFSYFTTAERSHATICVDSNKNMRTETIIFNLHDCDHNNSESISTLNTFSNVHNLNTNDLPHLSGTKCTGSSIDSVLNALTEPFNPNSPPHQFKPKYRNVSCTFT